MSFKNVFFFKNGTLSKGQTGVLNTHPGSVPAVAFKDCVRMVMSSIFAHSKPAQSLQVYFDKRPVVCWWLCSGSTLITGRFTATIHSFL